MQASMTAWIVTYLLHSTILVLGAWLIERRWGDRPERMSAVWKTALVGGLLTATVQTGLDVAPAAGQWTLATEPSIVVQSELPQAMPAAAAPLESPVLTRTSTPREPVDSTSWPPTHATVVTKPEALKLDRDAPVLAAASVTEPPASSSSASTVPATSSWWSIAIPWVLAVLGLGALLGLASVLVAFAALRRQLAGRREVADGTLPGLLEGLRRRAGIGRTIPLTVAPRVRVPMAVGVLRPEIVVPQLAAQALPPAHQESLLAHELAHVLRRDPTWRLVGLLAERVLFFQPLNRLASRRVAQAAEYLCDDWAARHTRKPLALASCLTEIATWVAHPGPVPATMAGPRSILGRRVQRLLQPSPASARPRWLTAALGVPLLAVVAVAPGVDARAARPERHEPAQIVVIDEAPKGGAVVVQERGGKLHVQPLDDDEARQAGLVEANPESRKAARARDKARRQARKELRHAFREAKQRDEAAPSPREVETILRRARGDEHDARSRSQPEHVDIHVLVPGEVSVHGRLPLSLEDLADLEDLEDLDAVKMLQALEQLAPVLEVLDAADVDVVMEHEGDVDELRIVISPERERARQRVRHDAERSRHDAEQATHEQLRWQHEHERATRRKAEHIEHDAERIRQQVERAQREHLRRSPPSELPTVLNRWPAPPTPPAPPARAPRVGPPHPPLAPVAPVPPSRSGAVAPRAPASEVGPVVWLSWPPTTSAAAAASA